MTRQVREKNFHGEGLSFIFKIQARGRRHNRKLSVERKDRRGWEKGNQYLVFLTGECKLGTLGR